MGEQEAQDFFGSIQGKIDHLQELYLLIEEFGAYSNQVANKIKEMRKVPFFQNSSELDVFILELAKHGLWTI